MFRICKRFTVESGHMLSKHPERCRYPHGHTRTIEVVVAGDSLDEQGMLLDFKALKLGVQAFVDRYDHAMAVNSSDPLLPQLRQMYPPDAVVVFADREPTTEAMAEEVFRFVEGLLSRGFAEGPYRIEAGRVQVERVRVWETPDCWAEFGR